MGGMTPGYIGNSRRRSCKSKRRFRDENTAKRARRRWPGQRVYRCEYCRGFHLTKQPLGV